MQSNQSYINPEIYQGQFDTFTITPADRQGVIIYRSALMMAAICFAVATGIVLSRFSIGSLSTSTPIANIDGTSLDLLTWLYLGFSVALGIALATIHIYLAILHRVLQLFWAIGSIAAIIFTIHTHRSIVQIIYQQPLTILGIGFTFAALTGIFFKEAFCFDRFETKLLVLIVPSLLLGHLTNLLPQTVKTILLAAWAGLFLIFAIRKSIQAIPPDIGDKSVFDHLKKQH
jgi:uncharacterized integral membrane protein